MYVDAKYLKSKMALKGYDIGKLSKATGLHRDTISNILTGKTAPSYNAINVIYYTLELTPKEGVEIFLNNDLRKKKVEVK